MVKKQKTIPQLEAEKAENERKDLAAPTQKQLENRITYYEKVIGASGRTTLSLVAQPLKASHR